MNNATIIDKYAARLLMISFFLPMKVQVLVAMACCLYFVFRTIYMRQLPARSSYLWALAISGCYLLFLFSFPFTVQEYIKPLALLCQSRASFLAMPFVFAIVSPALRTVILGEMKWFAYGCIASCVLANAAFVYQYVLHPHSAAPLSHVQYRIFFEQCSGIHPTYMGMFLCFSVCLLLPAQAVSRAGNILKYAFIYLCLIFLLSLLAKAPLIALMLIGIHYAWRERKDLYRYKWVAAGLLAAAAAVYLFIPFFRQRVAEMAGLFGTGHGSVADNSVYVRKLIWDVDTTMLRHYCLTGVGPGRLLHMLHERYFFYSISHHFSVGYYDPHNEYFFQWLSFGIAGIVLFATTLAIHFVKALKTKDNLYLYLLLILCVTFFTETVLSRQHGVMFYAVFTSLFFFRKKVFES